MTYYKCTRNGVCHTQYSKYSKSTINSSIRTAVIPKFLRLLVLGPSSTVVLQYLFRAILAFCIINDMHLPTVYYANIPQMYYQTVHPLKITGAPVAIPFCPTAVKVRGELQGNERTPMKGSHAAKSVRAALNLVPTRTRVPR